jgi:hypothetical protein
MASMKFEVAGVSRSVVSVGSLVSKGFDVSFDKDGGWISKGLRKVPLVKRGNRYFLRVKWRQARGASLELAPLEARMPRWTECTRSLTKIRKRLMQKNLSRHYKNQKELMLSYLVVRNNPGLWRFLRRLRVCPLKMKSVLIT